MTTLLTHTVAHSTKPSFMPKTNNQPLKKSLSLALSWAKILPGFQIEGKTDVWISQVRRVKNFLMGWLLVLGLKESLVECETVCVKSEVILIKRLYVKWIDIFLPKSENKTRINLSFFMIFLNTIRYICSTIFPDLMNMLHQLCALIRKLILML